MLNYAIVDFAKVEFLIIAMHVHVCVWGDHCIVIHYDFTMCLANHYYCSQS